MPRVLDKFSEAHVLRKSYRRRQIGDICARVDNVVGML